jgi:hypothetical protein
MADPPEKGIASYSQAKTLASTTGIHVIAQAC